MREYRFLEWNVYKDAKAVAKKIFKITASFPQIYRFDLGSQINSSTISMILNIAEGSGKDSDKDLNRFFNISIGSIYETIAGLDIAFDNGLMSDKDFKEIVNDLKSVGRQLGGFKRKLKNSFKS